MPQVRLRRVHQRRDVPERLDRQAGYVSTGNTYPIDEWTYWTSGHLPAGQLHQGHDAAPPVGAIIYFSNRLGHDSSHATISLGGGQQISPDTGSVSAPQSVDTNNFRTMLGWWLPDDQGGDPAPVLHPSVTASNNAGQLAVQVHDFPLGTRTSSATRERRRTSPPKARSPGAAR